MNPIFIQKYKKQKEIIFKNDKIAFLINVTFPRKNSRANTFTILRESDFA